MQTIIPECSVIGAPTGRILSLGILSERIRAERILAERIRAERILVTKYPPTVSILSRTYPIVNVSSVFTYPHRTSPPTDRILSLNPRYGVVLHCYIKTTNIIQ